MQQPCWKNVSITACSKACVDSSLQQLQDSVPAASMVAQELSIAGKSSSCTAAAHLATALKHQ